MKKDQYKTQTNLLINNLGILPIIINGKSKIIKNKYYPLLINFINYVEDNYMQYFENKSFYYSKYISKVIINSFLKNYTGYLKKELGHKKEINYLNFLNFLFDEYNRFSSSIIEKYSDIRKITIYNNKRKTYIKKYKCRIP